MKENSVSSAITIKELEQKLYSYVAGVLPPLTSTSSLGYTVRFEGYAVQQYPLHADVIRRNECYIMARNVKPIYYAKDGEDTVCEAELEYLITILNRQTNFILDDVMTQALRLCGSGDGYDFLDYVGISRFRPIRTYVKDERNNSCFVCEISLIIRALIKLEGIKESPLSDRIGINIYDHEHLVAEVSA